MPGSDQFLAPPAVWRAMQPADLPAVMELAALIHPDYPEDEAVFAERLRLFPAGCLVLQGAHGLMGYFVAHPWSAATPPALNRCFGALPASPTLYYLHDLALAPSARGSGAAGTGVAQARATAAAYGFSRLALVAVNGADAFWRRCGFAPAADAHLQAAAQAYDPQALYMILDLPSAPAAPGVKAVAGAAK